MKFHRTFYFVYRHRENHYTLKLIIQLKENISSIISLQVEECKVIFCGAWSEK